MDAYKQKVIDAMEQYTDDTKPITRILVYNFNNKE